MTPGLSRSATPHAGGTSIVIERTYRAPVEELWALWTTKDGFESWWAPDGYRVEVHLIEACLGGALEYDMFADGPEAIAAQQCEPILPLARARFAEFQPHRRLTLVHLMDFVAGTAPYDHRVEVDFRVSASLATMVVTLQPHPDLNRTNTEVRAFKEQLDKLDRRFVRAKAI